MPCQDLDSHIQQSLFNVALFQGVFGPTRHTHPRRGQRDTVTFTRQLFSDDRSHVVVIIIVNRDGTARLMRAFAVHDVVRGQRLTARDGKPDAPTHAVVAPQRTGRQCHRICAKLLDLSGIHLALKVHLDVGQTLDLTKTIVAHSCPLVQARQPAFTGHPASGLAPCFSEYDVIAALTQTKCRLKACRTRTDNENCRIRLLARNRFGMPSLAPLLTHGGILCAPTGCRKIVPGGTHIASNTFADIFRPPCFDLGGQKRISNRRTGRTDHVDHTATDG